jgi:OOP family OmpA-OmpF porin
MKLCFTAAVVASLAAPRASQADTWVTAETPAAFAVSDAQSGVFRPGVMPAFGVYAQRGHLALGVRARFGVLANGPAPTDHSMDPSTGGLATGGAALRLWGARGAWIEGVAGGGVTGHDAVPVFELGTGWDFAVGAVDLGPSLRIVHVVSDGTDRLGSADLALVGLDVKLGGRAKHRPVTRPVVAAAAVVAVVLAPDFVPERDGGAVAEAPLASCAQDSEACPVSTELVLVDDRIVLDDRVFFDTDRAKVRSAGLEIIQKLVKAWREHPEWERIAIGGHTDVRGTEQYNQELSQRRADMVKMWMVRYGADGDRIDAIGYGRSQPRDDGSSVEALQHNRRVEFVVTSKTGDAK